MKNVILILILNVFAFGDINIRSDSLFISKPIKSWIEFKNENLTRQNYDYSCGSASLSTILKYYYNLDIGEKDILDEILKLRGFNITEKDKLEENDVSLSFSDLAEFSNEKGFKSFGLALDLDSLSKLKVPVILFVKIRKNEHFTVFKNIDKNYVYLSDPSFGNIKVKISKFKEMFYQRDDLKYPGKILAIIPNNNSQSINKDLMNIQKHTDFVYEVIKDKMNNL
ncbi:C39 family peptidase [Aliarcobacter butzleri]|uniref:C39 family peptidase n=1 Tax=Aliarcobacter butzleri TaxID=28197 RepID=UPI00345074BE